MADSVQRTLVESAQHGDHEAFEVLVASVVDRLYAIARLILRDTHDAEDAVQETLVLAWKHLPALREPDRFDAWLRRLLVNACADERRHRRRFESQVRVLHLEPAATDRTTDLEDRERLELGFRRLKPEHRVVVVLRYYLDLSPAEIAHAVGIPVGTAKSRIHYATETLRAALDADARDGVATPNGHTA